MTNYETMNAGQADKWERAKTDVFWGEIAPAEHVLQIYQSEEALLTTLTAFIGAGINAGDCVIAIATQAHLNALAYRLALHGIQMADLIREGRYIPLSATIALSRFMVNDRPDERLFYKLISQLLKRARNDGRKVRAFSEMVALLLANDNKQATIALQDLWRRMVAEHEFSLLCAYPALGFTEHPATTIDELSKCYTRMIDGTEGQNHEVQYRNIPRD